MDEPNDVYEEIPDAPFLVLLAAIFGVALVSTLNDSKIIRFLTSIVEAVLGFNLAVLASVAVNRRRQYYRLKERQGD